MPSIFDINFSLQADNIIPPSKRKPKNMGFVYALLAPIQWLRDLLFDDYRLGAVYGNWINVTGYPYGSRVKYTDKCIYECINPAGAAGNGQSPTNPLYWYKIQENFIGVNERIKFNAQIIVFEYALNRWFEIPTTDPQIFIATNAALTSSSFILANGSGNSSKLVNNSLSATSYLTNNYIPPVNLFNYDINFPVAVFNALPQATSQDKENLIRQFVDKYNVAGMTYQLVIY